MQARDWEPFEGTHHWRRETKVGGSLQPFAEGATTECETKHWVVVVVVEEEEQPNITVK